jgi:radical SAM superfamily enzyme YgiQ (UPF0313 family)
MNNPKILLMAPITSLIRGVPLFPDLGLGYLASAVRKAGYQVDIRSWNMNPSVENFKRYIEDKQFDVIGIKVFSKDVGAANKTIKIIRSMSPETVIVVGGPHPSTSEPEEVMTDFPDCDFVFRGEAEIGLPLLIKYISENGKNNSEDLKAIPGLVWKNGDSIHSNLPFLLPDIDGLGMPLWEIMEPKDYKAPRIPGGPDGGYSAPLIVTRGCSSSCTYCAAYKINGKRTRSRSPKAVIEEIRLLYNKYHVRHFTIMDTRFTQYSDVVTEICDGIIENKMDIAWDCVGYENLTSLSESILRLMKNAGCKFVNVGIESGSDTIRKRIRKKGTTDEIFQKVQIIKDIGIGVRVFFMIGFPGEIKRDIEDTVNYAFSLPADDVQFEIVCPHPGTELIGYLKEKYHLNKIDWAEFDIHKSPYPLSKMDSLELYRILRKIRHRCLFMSVRRRFSALWK